MSPALIGIPQLAAALLLALLVSPPGACRREGGDGLRLGGQQRHAAAPPRKAAPAPDASAPAGRLDDRKAHPPADYNTLKLPARGAFYEDPAFGSRITRLSDGLAQFKEGVHHEYASMSPFNKDNSRILLLCENSGFFVADLQGNVVASPNEVGLGGLGEPRWSATDPNVFFFHDPGDNRIRKFDLATRQKTVVATFAQFRSIDFGGGESDLSEDGDHLVVVGDKRHVGLYSFRANRLGATLDTQGHGYDYADVTPDNNVIFRWDEQGAGRFKGFEVFDAEMRFLRQVYPYGAHADRGRDLNGEEALFILAATDLQPPPRCEGNGIEKIRLKDGKKTCLVTLNWDVGAHVSANGSADNPWILVEATDERAGTAKPEVILAPDWQTRWKPYYNEILLIKKDGSEVRRLAHHRSRSYDDYWYTPRAAISRDGSYAVFDSNFGLCPLRSYTDTFLLDLKRSVH